MATNNQTRTAMNLSRSQADQLNIQIIKSKETIGEIDAKLLALIVTDYAHLNEMTRFEEVSQ